MGDVELPEDGLRCPAVELGVQRPVAVELKVGVLVPQVVALYQFPCFGKQVDGLRLRLDPFVDIYIIPRFPSQLIASEVVGWREEGALTLSYRIRRAESAEAVAARSVGDFVLAPPGGGKAPI